MTSSKSDPESPVPERRFSRLLPSFTSSDTIKEADEEAVPGMAVVTNMSHQLPPRPPLQPAQRSRSSLQKRLSLYLPKAVTDFKLLKDPGRLQKPVPHLEPTSNGSGSPQALRRPHTSGIISPTPLPELIPPSPIEMGSPADTPKRLRKAKADTNKPLPFRSSDMVTASAPDLARPELNSPSIASSSASAQNSPQVSMPPAFASDTYLPRNPAPSTPTFNTETSAANVPTRPPIPSSPRTTSNTFGRPLSMRDMDGSKASRRKSWLPGAQARLRSRNASQDMIDDAKAPAAWINAGSNKIDYNLSFLINGQRVS